MTDAAGRSSAVHSTGRTRPIERGAAGRTSAAHSGRLAWAHRARRTGPDAARSLLLTKSYLEVDALVIVGWPLRQPSDSATFTQFPPLFRRGGRFVALSLSRLRSTAARCALGQLDGLRGLRRELHGPESLAILFELYLDSNALAWVYLDSRLASHSATRCLPFRRDAWVSDNPALTFRREARVT